MSEDKKDLEKCQINILKALESSPRVRFLMDALKNSGCYIGPKNFMCLPCEPSLSGGYNDESKLLIICANNCKNYEKVEKILAHELVHMYDDCTRFIDFKDTKHLACTEIRAASLVSCSKYSFDYKSFESCVQNNASRSVALVKDLSDSNAKEVVKSVFQKCFQDREPFGPGFQYRPDCALKNDFYMFSRYREQSEKNK